MGTFSIWHWLIVLAIIMLVFGTKKLRNFGADLGGAVQGFKEGIREASSAEAAAGASAAHGGDGKLIESSVAEKSEGVAAR